MTPVLIRSMALGLALLPCVASAQEAPTVASAAVAAPVPSLHDVAVTCRSGEIERRAGKTMGEVFGDDWPSEPSLPAGAVRVPPRPLSVGKLAWPSGLAGKRATVLVAVLVGADGKPVRAELLCESMAGFDHVARRAAMTGTYQAATLGGQPIMSPVVFPLRFSSAGRGSTNRSDRSSTAGSGD